MLAAFVTGFAKEASSMIDERNKEISDRALSEMEALLKKKAKADEAALGRRDELRRQAAELRAYNVPEQQIVGMLESGYASIAIEKLKKAEVGTSDMKRLFTPFDPEDQRLVEDYIKTATTLTGTAPKAYLDEETAFGLKTRAGTRVRESAARTVGVPLKELYKTDLPEMGITPTGTLDLNVLAEEKEAPTKAEVLASYAKKINDASDDPKEVRRLQKERDLYIERGFPKEEDKEKALTYSNAMSGLQRSISQSYTANSQKLGNSTFSIADDGTIRFAPGTAEHAQFFRNMVRKTIQDTTERYTDSEGRLPEPIAAAVNFMGNAYGIRVGRDRKIIVGEIAAPETPPAPPKPKGGAKPAASPTKPTLEQFMIRARTANPGATDAELERYYNDKYGNK